jgi:hypothetical protein
MTKVTGKNKGSELLYDAATQQPGRDDLLLRAFTYSAAPWLSTREEPPLSINDAIKPESELFSGYMQ